MQITQQKPEEQNKCLDIPNKNNLIFGIIVLCLQIVMSVIYGKFIITAMVKINIGSVIIAILIAVLAVAGFGLYFSYLQRLVWTSIGFNLLIVAFCIELYPLVNAFWIKCQIFQNPIYPDSFSTQNYNLYLSNRSSLQSKGNTITGSIRCALSLIVSFSSIIGRVGSLQCLILIIIGTIGFQLNRQIIMPIGQDLFGTFSIFTFGSFAGLAIAVFLTFRDKVVTDTKFQGKLQAEQQTIIYSIFGGLLIFTLLPILAYEGDNSNSIQNFNLYNGPLCIILAMGSSIIISISCFFFKYGLSGGIRIKDLLNGVIAGGVTCGTASYYITNPAFAMICGSVAAFVQFLFQHFIEPRIFNKIGLVTTYSFSLFGLQGLIGAMFAAIYNKRISNGISDAFTYSIPLSSPGSQISIYFISAGMGLASGIIIGLLTFCLNSYNKNEVMHDRKEWTSTDAIKYYVQKVLTGQNQQSGIIQTAQDDSPLNRPIQPAPLSEQPSQQQMQFDIADFLQVAIQ